MKQKVFFYIIKLLETYKKEVFYVSNKYRVHFYCISVITVFFIKENQWSGRINPAWVEFYSSYRLLSAKDSGIFSERIFFSNAKYLSSDMAGL